MADTDWVPGTWAGKRAMFENINDKIAGYAADLDLSVGDVTAIQNLCVEAMAVIDHQTQTQSTSQGTTGWRDNAFDAPMGGTLGAPPAGPTWAAPAGTKIGIMAELRHWREKWLSADKYTQAIGEDLMVVKTGEPLDPSGVTPLISVSPAQSGYLAGVTVSERGDSDMWIVETRQGGGSWQNAGSFTGKTADIVITPTTPGQPEVVDFRIRLRLKNADYGNLSLTATVTVNP